MKVSIVPADRLSPDLIRIWSEIQQADPALESPYYRPEYVRAVAAVKGPVEVAVIEDNGAPAGFFPFERRGGTGRPVGWPMCDYQGIIARKGLDWNPDAVVRACGLTAWDFDHVPAAQAAFGSYARVIARSPYIDLSAGFDNYVTERNKSGTKIIKTTLRKVRKAEREVGPLRFEYHTADPAVFATLAEWKREQYARTGAVDLFALGWPLKLLEGVRVATGAEFSGVLSALYLGDRLAAVQLSLRSQEVFHGWFPAYDPAFADYSPGLILVLELAKAAAVGVRRIDLGRGEEEYKLGLMSGAVPLTEGSVAVTSRTRLLRSGWYRTRDWMKSSRYAGPFRAVARATRPIREWLAVR
jgi:CelD/BcsL family acetyltransferase involved in cellulose biosynthesis